MVINYESVQELGFLNDNLPGFFYDLPNFLVCILLVFFISTKLRLPKVYSIILYAHCVFPFILNGVLFSPRYMPDQYKYFESVLHFRDFNFELMSTVSTIKYASILLGLVPIPFIISVNSLGFASVFLYILLFYLIYSDTKNSHYTALFYLMYPSLALYSSLGLRDTLILFLMIISILQLLKGHTVLSALLMLPLLFLKFQNAFLGFILIFTFSILKLDKKEINYKKLLLMALIGMLLFVLIFPIAVEEINFYRMAMYYEDGGEGVVPMISTFYDFIYFGIIGSFSFFLEPLPWSASNYFELIQSFENLILLIFIIYIYLFKSNKNKFFWICFILVSSVIYGLVVFNHGTMARYKFIFYVIFILGCTYDKKNVSVHQ